jgi:hypothetical protein
MAKATKKHTPRKSGRGSRSNPSKAAPLNLVRLEDVYRQLRDQGLEPNEVVQRMTALLRQWPSWIRYESFYGKETWKPLSVEFWQNDEAILSVGFDATDADCLVIDSTDYAHPSISYKRPQFFMRADDIGRESHLDDGGNNVISDYHDYHPHVEYAREVEGRPRPLTRLPPMPEAPASQTAPDQLEDKTGAGRLSTQERVTTAAIRLKKAGEISPKERRHPTDFAKLLQKEAGADVDWRHIKNKLRDWHLWPVESIPTESTKTS